MNTLFSVRLVQVSVKNYIILISSPGTNNDTAAALIEPALTPVTTSYEYLDLF